MAVYVPSGLLQIVRAFINPEQYIGGRSAVYERGVISRARKGVTLSLVYLIGLALYALPLTYAGFGMATATAEPPQQIAALAGAFGWNVAELWIFVRSFAENTAFLVTGSIAIFVVFHIAVVVLRTSQGLLQSVHTIVYASGMYLAAVYSFVWALSISESVVVADRVVLAVQSAFISTIIDLTGTSVTLPGGNVVMPNTAGMTTTGYVFLTGLAVSIVYLLYSLYAGVRTNHNGSRIQAFGTVVLVSSAPVLYVLGSIAISVFEIGIP